MAKISNDALALLMVAVIVVVIGAVFSLTWMRLPTTGADTAGGEVNLTVEEDITISVVANCSFGSGSFNISASDNCTLYSNETLAGVDPPNCWKNSTPYDPSDIVVKNEGTTKMDINFTSNTNSTDFINASSGKGGWYYSITNYTHAGSSCTGDTGATLNQWNEIVSDAPINYEVVNWSSGCGNEYVNVSFQVDLPDDVESENRLALLTFTSYAS